MTAFFIMDSGYEGEIVRNCTFDRNSTGNR